MWTPGTVILNDYEVLGRLGAGGMATVYLVRQLDLGKQFAVKVPHPTLTDSAERRRLFTGEIQTWISLPRHPHLVESYFVREVEQVPVVFAEYVASGTLEGWLNRGRVHSVAHTLDLAIQLAEAMSIAERRGIVHRDLKPSNCLLTERGLLKVGDFGLAAALEKTTRESSEAVSGGHSHSGFFVGTLSYCSPEQYEGQSLDTRSDIWSFGVTLYELLTGKRPALGPAAPFAIRRYRETAEGRTIRPEIWDFLLTLLELEPARRLASFATASRRMQELYRLVTRGNYPRTFPREEASGSQDAAATRHGIAPAAPTTATGRAGARNVLVRALQRAGRDPAEADQVDAGGTAGGSRSRETELLAALAMHNEAANIYRELIEQTPSETLLAEMRSLQYAIAGTHRRLGNLSAAISAYDESVKYLHILLRRNRNSHIACTLVATINDRAVCRRQKGDLAGAIADYGRGIALFKTGDPGRYGWGFLNLFASLFQNRAMAMLKTMRLNHSLRDITRAIELREKLVDEQGRNEYAVDLAGSYVNRAVVHRNMNDTAAAIDDYSRALEMCQRPNAAGALTEKRPILPMIHLNRAVVYLAMRAPHKARPDCERAVELYGERVDREDSLEARVHLAEAYNNRANIHSEQGDANGALEDMERCIEIRERLILERGMHHLTGALVRASVNQVLFLSHAGRFDDAAQSAERAIELVESIGRRKGHREISPETAKLRLLRGTSRVTTGRMKAGLADIDTAIQQCESLLSSENPAVCDQLIEALAARTAVATGMLGQQAGARAHYIRAIDDPNHTKMLEIVAHGLERLERTLEKSGGHMSRYASSWLVRLSGLLAPLVDSNGGKLRALLDRLRRRARGERPQGGLSQMSDGDENRR